MPDYKTMYFGLFNAVTDALEEMGKLNFGTAAEMLRAAQQAGEDRYAEASDSGEDADMDGGSASLGR